MMLLVLMNRVLGIRNELESIDYAFLFVSSHFLSAPNETNFGILSALYHDRESFLVCDCRPFGKSERKLISLNAKINKSFGEKLHTKHSRERIWKSSRGI